MVRNILKSKTSRIQTTTSHKGVDRSLAYISSRFHRRIQLKDMVKVSTMSRRGFCKAFKKKTGVNPGEYLRYLRVECAKRLLVEQDLKLRQIAPRCGFRSENTLAVAFQREVGMSPKQFQRQFWLSVYRTHPPESLLSTTILDLAAAPRESRKRSTVYL